MEPPWGFIHSELFAFPFFLQQGKWGRKNAQAAIYNVASPYIARSYIQYYLTKDEKGGQDHDVPDNPSALFPSLHRGLNLTPVA